ncbi:MAG: RNA polymerase sigma factor [Pirellulales bacterium]|nr:RNA polymerase sigma factor [Pirellulales bacterium]
MVQDKPQDGIAELVARYHRELFAYAYRLTGRAADAEDLTQQTFLAACAAYHSLRDARCARGWLYAILRSQYLKQFSRARRLVINEDPTELEQIPEELPYEPDFDQELLQQALDRLPAEFKVVVLMFYFEGCSYKEIAEQLKLPPGTVMSRLARAKQRLRDALLHTGQPAFNGSMEAGVPQVVREGTPHVGG